LPREAGKQIDESDEQYKNDKCSIIESFESGSKVTAERDTHSAKQDWPSFSTKEGMQIDASEKQQ
jgi:hypothetical protein